MKNINLRYPLTIFLCFITIVQSVFAGPPPTLVGESAILIDSTTGTILYKKNAHIQMYPASTTKILTSILCIENMDTNSLMFKTNESIRNVPSDSSHIGLRVGDKFSVLDGIYAVMLGSDNYAAYDLAVKLDGSIESFSRRMNEKARQIGATKSNFVNPHGYHHPDHYTTAYDLALIADYAFENNIFRNITQTPLYKLTRFNDPSHPIEFSNTVKLIQPDSPFYFPYTVGGKTGFNTPAGRSLVAVAEKNGLQLIGVVLKSTSPEFFEDMATLFNYGFENFQLEKEGNITYLNNISFSSWAKDVIAFAKNKQLIDPLLTQNYQTPVSQKDFIQLLFRTIYVAQYENLDGFSNEIAIEQALSGKLIQSSSLLSGFEGPLDRQTAATLIDQFLSDINYRPLMLYPYNQYEDHSSIALNSINSIYFLQQSGVMGSYKGGTFNPQDHLTLEESIAIAAKLYKLYSTSPYRSLNMTNFKSYYKTN